ncbi:D-glycero-alpha-D-manno-heptose 1-phosphate guanylyltransferase [Filimonas lacunae]|uniref:D-glycero-alpha-D-manno-heptose 1-phosphate guanylyltransferase n=1 Tax=Filimonas lacunae TaxID=477680 RepID=A0A173MF85_9BACT|nr:sugar phosphate nucleotidyltransferase [Filimonas lacunae]BAV06263.1 D-glycero-D-manno-heptose 1-phosphate guanosyltransferase [Filimonas lacunae]SIT25536.1 D-glycero-alpha-D-manno-heptose 1-phosphate guanylyltransferase [Filimonas lacunae]
MITEAIVLAGGLGTRLRSAVPELPKCMAPVNGKPFLQYVITSLQQQGIEHFVFALGYKHDYFLSFLQQALPQGNYSISTEDEPLGTGGAIKHACRLVKSNTVLVTNGDTLFKGNVAQLSQFHQQQQAACTLLLKPMQQFDRFGVVETDVQGRITSFKEKQYYEQGFINAGMFALNIPAFVQEALPQKFSFEKDYLEALYQQRVMCGLVQDAYFIDIGIPEDYERVQTELAGV